MSDSTFYMLLIVIACAMWAGTDAQQFKARELRLTGISWTSPGARALGVLLLWIVLFPMYLAERGRLARRTDEEIVAEAERRRQQRPAA